MGKVKSLVGVLISFILFTLVFMFFPRTAVSFVALTTSEFFWLRYLFDWYTVDLIVHVHSRYFITSIRYQNWANIESNFIKSFQYSFNISCWASLRARSFGIFRNKNIFRNYSGIYYGYSAPGSRIAGMEIQVFQNENSSQTNAYSHYSDSDYSYSRLIPNKRALRLFALDFYAW